MIIVDMRVQDQPHILNFESKSFDVGSDLSGRLSVAAVDQYVALVGCDQYGCYSSGTDVVGISEDFERFVWFIPLCAPIARICMNGRRIENAAPYRRYDQ